MEPIAPKIKLLVVTNFNNHYDTENADSLIKILEHIPEEDRFEALKTFKSAPRKCTTASN